MAQFQKCSKNESKGHFEFDVEVSKMSLFSINQSINRFRVKQHPSPRRAEGAHARYHTRTHPTINTRGSSAGSTPGTDGGRDNRVNGQGERTRRAPGGAQELGRQRWRGRRPVSPRIQVEVVSTHDDLREHQVEPRRSVSSCLVTTEGGEEKERERGISIA